MGPFTALMTVDHATVEDTAGKRSFVRAAAERVAAVVESVRHQAADRRLRDQLADMDASMLKDIGIADDEIHMIRARHRFTPRSWANRGIGGSSWTA